MQKLCFPQKKLGFPLQNLGFPEKKPGFPVQKRGFPEKNWASGGCLETPGGRAAPGN